MKFWETKKLHEMTPDEWESLCDNCGKCCLHKLEDEDTGEIYFTSVVCNLIDLNTCLCTDYENRCTRVPECIDLKQHDFAEYTWLPSTCAYRLLSDGKPLEAWHPLVSDDPNSVVDAGVSIRSYAMKEADVDDIEEHIIEWQS
ncbi:MAG: YcgN family cysteine cluster protein [Methylococcaceae bacterium]|nr:YcgN family cysteine cluster protein [Methylococcaceae bacterium]